MQTIQLGTSGLSVSKLCFGTLTMSPLQKNMSPADGARLLIHAYERGIRFLDTADLYETYPHIREALKCKETGQKKTILFCLSGHGLIDMAAYDQYLAGNIH